MKKRKPSPPNPCQYCKGKGYEIVVVYDEDNEEYVKVPCAACLGTGKAR